MMSKASDQLYDAFMAPLENRWLGKRRTQLMAHAEGHVLEIGFGTGVNLKYYDPERISSLTALDPEPAQILRLPLGLDFRAVSGHAEKLPFEDCSFDTVVETLVLCSVSNPEASLLEIIRVLRPGGKFIFMDHVLPESRVLAAVFKGINGIWPHLSGGCNLDRSPHRLIDASGMSILESGAFAKSVFRYGVAEK